MPSPIVAATAQATFLSAISNILGQLLYAYRKDLPLSISPVAFLRFIVVTVLTAPPNYLWQAFLERSFPGRARLHPDVADAIALEEQRKLDDGPHVSYREALGLRDAHALDHEREHLGHAHAHSHAPPPRLDYRNTAIKWFVDCITVGAVLNTVAFLVLMGALKGKSTAAIGASVRDETVPIIVAGYKMWPLASVVSFAFVPVEKRIVFLSFIGLLWGIYLSLVAEDV